MRDEGAAVAPRIILPGALVIGWLLGLLGQRSIVEATGYLDISPQLLLLASGLCILAGATARLLAPQLRGLRAGALAGIAMAATMVAGCLGLAVAYADRFDSGSSGETWFSLLLEARSWIGVPIVLSAILGALGWLAAAAYRHGGHRSGGGGPT
ncbi:MAG: hypothetical protein A2V84_09405 [Chloroflexi bacterium RBG_16_70_13]|nr:MAG: hypothetical protein A2V84_09405 [Chloroflexi bacterium RBG_16_70_13]